MIKILEYIKYIINNKLNVLLMLDIRSNCCFFMYNYLLVLFSSLKFYYYHYNIILSNSSKLYKNNFFKNEILLKKSLNLNFIFKNY